KGHSDTAGNLVFLKDGKTLVTSGADSKLCAWDTATGGLLEELRVPNAVSHPLSRTEDGGGVHFLGTVERSVYEWRPLAGQGAKRVDAPVPLNFHSAVSGDGRLLAVTGQDAKLRLLETATGKERAVFPLEGYTLNAAPVISVDGRVLAARCADGLFRVWD